MRTHLNHKRVTQTIDGRQFKFGRAIIITERRNPSKDNYTYIVFVTNIRYCTTDDLMALSEE